MLTLNIARRFLFSRKSHSIVNLIAVVSVVAIAVPTAAMILVLSLHNGIYDHLRSLYGSVDSPISVTATEGQFFEVDSSQMADLYSIGATSKTLDCNALVEYASRQAIATIRGVDSAYTAVNQIASTVERGEWQTKIGDNDRAVIGSGLSYSLGLSLGMTEPIYIYSILPTPPVLKFLDIPLMGEGQIQAAGVFSLEAQTDSRFIFTSIDFVRELTGQTDAISSIEIAPTIDIEQAKIEIAKILGPNVTIKDKFAQRAMIYSVVESEKWMVYLVLALVAMIASMSLVGCTLVMMSEKREATATLRAIGMNDRRIRRIYINLSMIIVMIGVVSGVAIGVGLSLVQLYFEPLKMAGDTLINNSYMVAIYFSDIATTSLSILAVGTTIVLLTVNSQMKKTKA